ncbi:MAG: 50S ribosomal protein L24 [Parcubacteria group bacterium GW2011_GWB1_41_4]|nr:MAG: 50S ribosomal protein L24 [Parcubacteria group bacterium GW2011_GWB1_41_4]
MKLKLKKGDFVKVVSGKDKGKQAKILRTIPDSGKVVLEGLFLVKKIKRPKKAGEKAEIMNVSMPVFASKLMLICSSCGKASRSGYSLTDKEKTRVCRRCGNKI